MSTYELSEKQLKRALESYDKYEESGIVYTYNKLCKKQNGKLPDKVVHYAAGTLELSPSEARNDLMVIQVLKGNYPKGTNLEKKYTVYSVSKLVIDNIMRDPKLTQEEKNKKICELELAEYERVSKNVEEANRIQHTDKYKVQKEDDSRRIS